MGRLAHWAAEQRRRRGRLGRRCRWRGAGGAGWWLRRLGCAQFVDETGCCDGDEDGGGGLRGVTGDGLPGSSDAFGHGDQQPAGDAPVVPRHRVHQVGAHRAALEVGFGVELRLASLIAHGHRQQHGSAPVRGQLDAPEGEEELESKVRPSTGEAHGDRAAADVALAGECGEIGPCDLVAEQELALGRVELGQGRCERLGLLLVDGQLCRIVGTVTVEQPMEVTTAHGLAAEVRCQQVAGDDHGVGTLGIGRERSLGVGEPGQGLLREVVDEMTIAGACGQRPPHDRGDVGEGVRTRAQPSPVPAAASARTAQVGLGDVMAGGRRRCPLMTALVAVARQRRPRRMNR